MNPHPPTHHGLEIRVIKITYLILLFIMGLTGFAQMPIFKRYYIADIPGLGWLAEFYVTHTIHYIGAILLLFLIAYCIIIYMGMMKKEYVLTRSAYLRIVLLSAIVITGVFRVLKNFPDVVFSPNFTMLIDISHLIFMMGYMVFGAVFMVRKNRWLEKKIRTL